MFYFCLFLFFFKQWLCQRSTFFPPCKTITPSDITTHIITTALLFESPRIASLVNAHFMLRKHMKAKPHAWSIPATHGLDTVLVFSCSLYYCLVSHMHTQKVRKPKEQMKLLSAAPAPPPQLTVLPWSLLFLPPFFPSYLYRCSPFSVFVCSLHSTLFPTSSSLHPTTSLNSLISLLPQPL